MQINDPLQKELHRIFVCHGNILADHGRTAIDQKVLTDFKQVIAPPICQDKNSVNLIHRIIPEPLFHAHVGVKTRDIVENV